MKTLQDAVEEGYHAWEIDKNCPYLYDTEEFYAWTAGWLKAELDNHPNPRIRAIRHSYKKRHENKCNKKCESKI